MRHIKISPLGAFSSKSEGPSVLLFLSGSGEVRGEGTSCGVTEGSSVIVGSDRDFTITSYNDGLELYQAKIGQVS